jgi:dipeptidyl aminopeptidase/acylaminoacyl peptidase
MKTALILLATLSLSAVAQTPKGKGKRPRAPLPDTVEMRSVTVFSDGTRMAGDLYLPKGLKPEDKLPGIVLCAGTGGTKGGTQARLAPRFATQGYIVLAFDYRGWGMSESLLMATEQQMNYAYQTEDIRAAISFVAGEPNVDKERIGLWGSSYGGGLVTWVAGNDPRVKCVAAQVPGMGGARAPAAMKYAYDLATKQARGETEPVPIETGKMGGKMATYDQMRVNPVKNIGFSALDAAAKISAPALFVIAENEELSSNDTVESVHQALVERGVPSKLHVFKGITHYGVYGEGFEEATQVELEWFNAHLKP